MMLSTGERDRRWAEVRRLMDENDLDVLVAHGNAGDVPADQRYVSGYRPIFGDVAVLLFGDGDAELIVATPAVVGFAKQLSWIEQPVVGAVAKPWLVGGLVEKPVIAAPTIGEEV